MSSSAPLPSRFSDRRITLGLLSIVFVILYVLWQPNASLTTNTGMRTPITVPITTPLRARAVAPAKPDAPSYDTATVAQGWQFADSDPDPKAVGAVASIRMVTSTRFWGNTVDDLERLKLFVDRALLYSDIIIIALRIELDRTDTSAYIQENYNDGRVRVLPVRPWLVVTTSLNAVMVAAAMMNAQYLCYQSIEVTATKAHVDILMAQMNDDTFFVGAAIPNGHHFKEGVQPLGGLTCPWNTLGVWRLKSLLKVGFGGIADRPPAFEFQRGGLEEVTTAALLQLLASHMTTRREAEDNTISLAAIPAKVKLVAMPADLEWQVDFSSPLRRDRHTRKINAKQSHGDDLLDKMGMTGYGTVIHVVPKEVNVRTPVRIG